MIGGKGMSYNDYDPEYSLPPEICDNCDEFNEDEVCPWTFVYERCPTFLMANNASYCITHREIMPCWACHCEVMIQVME